MYDLTKTLTNDSQQKRNKSVAIHKLHFNWLFKNNSSNLEFFLNTVIPPQRRCSDLPQ